jgi:hypothetical protein
MYAVRDWIVKREASRKRGKSDHTTFVHMICRDKSPVRCAPPLTKGGRGDFASDGPHHCTTVVWFDLG